MRLIGFVLLVLLAFFTSCKKEGKEIIWEILHTEPGIEFRSIHSHNDSLLVSGFSNKLDDTGGILIFSDFSANQSPVFFPTNFQAFDFVKMQGRWFIGADSAHFYRTNNFIDYKRIFIDSANWVSYLQQQPLLRFVVTKEGEQFLAVGGGNTGYGVTYLCTPKENEWLATEYDFEIRSAFKEDEQNNVWLVGNGLLSSSNASSISAGFKQQRFDNKYIMDIAFSDKSTGVICMHNGTIYTTNNGGESWQKAKGVRGTNRYGKGALNRVKWVKGLSAWVVIGNGGKVYKSSDTKSWHRYDGFSRENLYDFEVADDNTLLIAASEGKVFRASFP